MEMVYISPDKKTLKLTNNADFNFTADGLTSADIDITDTDDYYSDGSVVNNTHALPRPINLYLTIKQGRNVEQAKRNITAVVKPKQKGTLRWTYEGRTIEIVGTVQTITMPRFEKAVVMQISLYCNQPYWQDAEYIIKQISEIEPRHRFKLAFPAKRGIVFGVYNKNMSKEFENMGDSAVGCIINIVATGDIKNPLLQRSDGTYFGFKNLTMAANDEIVINTAKGEKTVTKNGVDIFENIKDGVTWFQIEPGKNMFTISEEGGTGNMYFDFKYKQKYI